MTLPIGNASGGQKDPEGHYTSKISVKRSVAGRLGSGWWGQTGTKTCVKSVQCEGPYFSKRKEF